MHKILSREDIKDFIDAYLADYKLHKCTDPLLEDFTEFVAYEFELLGMNFYRELSNWRAFKQNVGAILWRYASKEDHEPYDDMEKRLFAYIDEYFEVVERINRDEKLGVKFEPLKCFKYDASTALCGQVFACVTAGIMVVCYLGDFASKVMLEGMESKELER